MPNSYYVYILTNKPRGTFYIGVTNDLARRIWEHHQGKGSKFVKNYNLYKLVYSEVFDDIDAAIEREKRLKRWRRQWKIELIEASNPQWQDMSLQNLG